jgi:hypothetical protein
LTREELLRSSHKEPAVIPSRIGGVLLGVVACAGALGQDAKPAPAVNQATVLVLDYQPLDRWLVDPKDRPLAEALSMLPARLQEVVNDPSVQVPPQAATAILTIVPALGRSGRIIAKYNGDMPSGGLFGYGVSYSSLARDEKDAQSFHEKLISLLPERGGPRFTDSKRFPGMRDLQTPAGLLSFGPRHAKDGWRNEVIFGTMDSLDEAVAELPEAPAGVSPVMRATMNFAGLTALKEFGLQMAGQKPEVLEQIAKVEKAGLVGPDAVKVDVVVGTTGDRITSRSRVHGAKKYAGAWNLVEQPLSASRLKAVPADAVAALIGAMPEDTLRNVWEMLNERAEGAKNLQESFRDETGVDLDKDVFASLGGGYAMYLSDATGGSGLGSAVAMISVRDRARLSKAIEKIRATLNDKLAEMKTPASRCELSAWKDGKTSLVSLRLRGLPLPIEPTFAFVDDWLIFSPTPQGAVAAARQASGLGDAGIGSNPGVRSSGLPVERAISLTFVDSPRLIRDGYIASSFAGSAIANAMRSPTGDRDPGMIVPLYADLARDAKASASVAYWEGDSLVMDAVADRSMLVNAAATAGLGMKALPIVAAGAIAVAAREKHDWAILGTEGRVMERLMGDQSARLFAGAGGVLGPAGVLEATALSGQYAPWSRVLVPLAIVEDARTGIAP